MFALLPKNLLQNPDLTWCDPCCGNGYFSIYLYHQLFKNLTEIKELKKRHCHIMQMLSMIELNPFHIPVLKNIFGEKSKIYQKNFLETNKKYDIILNMEIALEYLTKKEVRLAFLAKKFQEDINYLNIS